MSSPARGLAGTSASGTATHLTSVDTTYAAPPINTTARAPSLAASVEDTPDILVGDNQTVRIRTLAGFFKFIGDCLYFPKGQRLCTDDVRRSGVGQPIWFLTGLLGALGALRTYLTPGLFGELAAVGDVVGRFIQGYWMGPGLLTLAGDVAGRFIPGLRGTLQAVGDVAGHFIPGTWLDPATLPLVGAISERFIPGLRANLGLLGQVAADLIRGRTLNALLTLAASLGPRQITAGRQALLQAQATMTRLITRSAVAASVPLHAAFSAGFGFLAPALDATLDVIGALALLRGKVLQGSVTLTGALRGLGVPGLLGTLRAVGALAHHAARGLPGNLRQAGALLREMDTSLPGAALSLAAMLARGFPRVLDSSVDVVGDLAGRFVPGLWASLTASAALLTRYLPVFAASLTAAGELVEHFGPGFFLPTANGALAAALYAWLSAKQVVGTLVPAGVVRAYQSGKTLLAQMRASAFIVIQYIFSSGDGWGGGGTTSARDTQSWQGGGTHTTPDARSWQGGGTHTTPDARSWQGGGTPTAPDARSWQGGGTPSTLDTGSWSGGTTYATRDVHAWGGGLETATPWDAQAWGGGLKTTTPWDAGSWGGGAVAGIINSAHTRGYFVGGVAPNLGGNVNAVPLWLVSGGGTQANTRNGYGGPGGFAFGTYVKMPAYTSNGTLLWDLWLGTIGYTRCSIGNTGVIKAELSYTDVNVSSTSLTVTSGAFAVPLAQWVWVWVRQTPSGNGWCGDGNVYLSFQVGWNTSTTQNNVSVNTGNWCSSFNVMYWGQLGVGVPLSPSTSYDPFPNTAGYEMSKFRYTPSGNPAFSPPTIDATAGNYGIVYNARQPAGTATSLVDTGSQWHGTPGAQGLTIYTDGPYP